MSNALLEAMSVGLPCVASRVGGNTELIESGSSGLLFEAGVVNQLTEQLTTLAVDPDLRRSLGENARNRVQRNYSLERMLSDYSNLYRSLANKEINPSESAELSCVPDGQLTTVD
jgi:glycosyltransferase involved in cell wall biosynthesis